MKKVVCFSFFLLIISFVSLGFSEPKEITPGHIVVYPNPWVPESGISTNEKNGERNTLKHGHLSAEGWIKFAGIQQNTGTLRIYDITGNLVRNFKWNIENEKSYFPVPKYEFSHKYDDDNVTQEWKDKNNGINIIHWDGKDNNFEYVKSGVYIWILSEDGGHTHHGKIAIVR